MAAIDAMAVAWGDAEVALPLSRMNPSARHVSSEPRAVLPSAAITVVVVAKSAASCPPLDLHGPFLLHMQTGRSALL